MHDATASIPAPHPGEHTVTLWLEEQIWGHRLWDAQTPWLLFLEFLNISEGCLRLGKLLDEGPGHTPIVYRPYRRMFLRNILFNNDKIAEFDERYRDSGSAWAAWLKWMTEQCDAVTPRDFSYLKIHFHSFHDFASLVGLLRSSAVESDTNKRWTSRFVFPFGPRGLYVDLNLTPTGDTSREYINFGRRNPGWTGPFSLLLSRRTCRCPASLSPPTRR